MFFFIATGRNIFLPLFFFVVPLALQFFAPFFLFLFAPFFVCLWQSVCFSYLDFKGCFFDCIFIFGGGGSVCFSVRFSGSFLGFGLGSVLVLVFVLWWWFWFGFLCSLPALKSLWNGGFSPFYLSLRVHNLFRFSIFLFRFLYDLFIKKAV